MYSTTSQECGSCHASRPSSAPAGGMAQPTFGMSSRDLHAQLSERSGGRRNLAHAGITTLASNVDEVVFGRDLDASGQSVQDVRSAECFRGAHGKTSKQFDADPLGGNARRRLRGNSGVQAKALIFGDRCLSLFF